MAGIIQKNIEKAIPLQPIISSDVGGWHIVLITLRRC